MKVLFVGSLFPENRKNEIKLNSKNGMDNAANNLQWAFLKGIDYYYKNTQVITLPAIRTFPFYYKKFIFKGSNFSHKFDSEDFCLGFINIPIIKHITKYYQLKKRIKKLINENENCIIVIYGIHSPYLKAIYDLKRIFTRLKICVIVPDLPNFMSESSNAVYLILKKIDSIIINKCLKRIDSFVLLSECMSETLKIENKPWVRIEGIFESIIDKCTDIEKRPNVIFYSGSLDRRYGIENLVKGFMSINNSNLELWICGDGNYKKELIKLSILDSRIKYLGLVSYEKVLCMQRQSAVLVNPRTSLGEFTKYSFPSKTMEYLASGTPTIIHQLEGIPKEYYEYVFVAEEESADGLRSEIINVLSKSTSELQEIGVRASKFILENKTPIFQVEKMWKMLKNL